MKEFVEVDEKGRLKREEEKIGVQKQEMRKKIRNIEERVGIRMIKRKKRYVQKKEEGERIMEKVGNEMEEIERGFEKIGEMRERN